MCLKQNKKMSLAAFFLIFNKTADLRVQHFARCTGENSLDVDIQQHLYSFPWAAQRSF